MSSTFYSVLLVVIMSLVTILIRFLPFIVFNGRLTPKYITYLGKVLPYSIMGMLVVYCLKETSFGSISMFMPQLIAGAEVAISYAWKKNTLISIVSGTVLYMVLVQMVF